MSPLRRSPGVYDPRPAHATPVADVGINARPVAVVAGLLVVLIGIGVLIAWQLMGHAQFRAWATLVSTKPNTAAGFIAAGASVLLLARESWRKVAFPVAWLLALVPLLIGGLTIAEYTGLTRVNIDELIVPVESILAETADGVRTGDPASASEAGGPTTDGANLEDVPLGTPLDAETRDGQAGVAEAIPPAQIPSLSAASLVMIGLGLLLLEVSPGASQVLAVTTFWLGLLATLGHLFGVQNLTGWETHSEIAPEAALTFTVLALGLLLVRPCKGPVAVLLGADAGGVAARRLLPPVMAVLVLSGVLVIYGEEHAWFEMRFGITAMVLFGIVILTGLIWLNAERLGEMDRERRLAEQRTAEQRDWLATTLASIGDAVVTTDKDGRITFMNRVAEQLTGWPRAEAVGRPLSEVVPLRDEQSRTSVPDPVNVALSGRADGLGDRHLLLQCREGRETIISHSVSAIRRRPDGSGHGVVLVFRDVGQERRAEAALRDSEAKFRSILDNTQAAVFAKDRQGRYIIGNRHLAEMFGWPDPSFPLGKTDRDLYPAEMAEAFWANDQTVLKSEAPLEFEEMVEVQGQKRMYLVQKFPLRDAKGVVYGVCGIANDISRRKQGELILTRNARQQRAAADLGRLALTERDLQRVLDRCVETVTAVLDNEYCKVLERLPDQGRLLLRAGTGWRDGLVGTATVGGDRESHAGFTLRSNEPVIVEDLAQETRFRNSTLLEDHGVVSGMSCIIPGPDGQAWGVLGTHTRRRCLYTADDVNFLQTVAHIIASALQRGEVEEALRRSEQQLRFTLDAARVGAWDWDIRTGRIHWSQNLEEIHGMAPGSFGGTLEEVLDEVFPQDRQQLEEAIERALSTDGRFETTYRYRRRDGSLGWLQSQGHVVFDVDGKPQRMAGLCMDVTQQRRTHELTSLLAEAGAHLGQSYEYEASLQIVADLLVPSFGDWCAIDLLDDQGQLQSVAIVHSDPQKVSVARELRRRYPPRADDPHGSMHVVRTGRSQLIHEVTEQVLEVSAQDAEHLRLLQDLNLQSAMIVPMMAHGRALGVMTLVSAESSRRYHQDDLAPVEELAIRCALAVDNARLYESAQQEIKQRELTEQLLARAHDAAAAASAAKSEFVANMSHEIRTPMTAILGYTDILGAKLDDPDDLQCVETIRRNGQFLLEIVNDILDLSKIEAGKLEVDAERVRVDQLVGDVLAMMEVRATEKQLSLTSQFEGPIPETIESDPTRLRQILINLLGNAIKFTESGEIRLSVRLLEEQQLLELSISDTGIGMSAEQMARLFEPFSQGDASVARNYGGTGLGLSICRRLAQMLGGEIAVESEPGRGSTFSVKIGTGSLEGVPLIEPREQIPAGEAPSSSPEVSLGCRVLIVDDRQEIRFLAEHFVRDAGGDVVTANNGEEALEQVQRCRASGTPIDVVLLDIQMPVMDGYQAASRLREQGFEGPVIALTANAMQGDRERCLRAGYDDHTSKPLNGPQLVSMIAHYTTEVSTAELSARRGAAQRSPEGASAVCEKSAPAETADTAEPESNGCRVLFVDDSDDLCRMMRMLLESRGHHVRTANNGQAAIEIAKAFAPEVILLDLTLPDISGCEVAARLSHASQTRDSVLIAVSGDTHPDTLERVRQSGFHHHVLKPVDVQELESLFPICGQLT